MREDELYEHLLELDKILLKYTATRCTDKGPNKLLVEIRVKTAAYLWSKSNSYEQIKEARRKWDSKNGTNNR